MPELRTAEAVLHYEQVGEGPDLVWLSGGDSPGSVWDEYQLPYFEDAFRNTTYDNRGVGRTRPLRPPPWTMEDYGADCASLIEAVCDPPVVLVGLSMGSLIAQQVALDRSELVRCAILLGTLARSTGFLYEWMAAEIEFRRQGGSLSPPFAVAHYGVLGYPAEVLGDDGLWARLRSRIARYEERDDELLAAQWQACLDFDSLERLPTCEVPLHVLAFSEDVQTPPSRGRLVAETAPHGHFHLFEGMGHVSLYGHRSEAVNRFIRELVVRYAA